MIEQGPVWVAPHHAAQATDTLFKVSLPEGEHEAADIMASDIYMRVGHFITSESPSSRGRPANSRCVTSAAYIPSGVAGRHSMKLDVHLKFVNC